MMCYSSGRPDCRFSLVVVDVVDAVWIPLMDRLDLVCRCCHSDSNLKAVKLSVSDVRHRWLRSCERYVFIRVLSRWQSPQVPFLLYCTLSAVPRANIYDRLISPSRFQLPSPAQRAAAVEKSLLLFWQRFRNEHICAFKFCSCELPFVSTY